MDKWRSYDQITLIPNQVSTLEHRSEADTSVEFGPLTLKIPIIAAPMPDVSNGEMAHRLKGLGSFGWVHRFQSLSQQEKELHQRNTLTGTFDYPNRLGAAVGLNDYYDRISVLHNAGVQVFCLDTANGASQMVEKAILNIKKHFPDVFLVVGNIASFENFYRLQEWGADAIRVGIAGGSVCETRTETGIYSPMASVISETYQQIRKSVRKALLIADGGIKSPGDMCKALALGADCVMIGGALAGTSESPGDVILIDGKKHKYLRGAASYSTQKENGNEDPEYIEGRETPVPYRGSVKDVIDRYAAGLRSSMSYNNARTLAEFRQNVTIKEVA